ncbi:MAG: hypothetical protein J7L98_03955 [Candidatus Verstraetearchaeota archaeon]|nr:hypothetical protein [Candidatus Verstraetearchaeota archaeon]
MESFTSYGLQKFLSLVPGWNLVGSTYIPANITAPKSKVLPVYFTYDPEAKR